MAKFTKVEIQPEVTKDITFKLELTRTATPKQFRNLWSLSCTDKNGNRAETFVDNDSLSMCIDKIGYILEQEGF